MATDLFEKLADLPVPPVPEKFDRGVHDRINTRLLAGQFLDLGMRRVRVCLCISPERWWDSSN